MNECDRLRERVADAGDAAFDDPTLNDHRATCADCDAFLDALHRIDASLNELPVIAAPGELVARTVLAVRDDAPPQVEPIWSDATPTAPSRWRRAAGRARAVRTRVRTLMRAAPALGARLPLPQVSRRVWLGGIAAMLLLGIIVPNAFNYIQRSLQKRTMADHVDGTAYDAAPKSEPVMPGNSGAEGGVALSQLAEPQQTDRETYRKLQPPSIQPPPPPPAPSGPRPNAAARPVPKESSELKKALEEIQYDDADGQNKDNSVRSLRGQAPGDQQLAEQRARGLAWQLDAASAYNQQAKGKAGVKSDESVGDKKTELNEKLLATGHTSATDELLARPQRGPAPDAVRTEFRAGDIHFSGGFARPSRKPVSDSLDRGGEIGQLLLNSLTWNDQLRYQDAAGYWDNTYVPGDPWIRLLEARLRKNDIPFLAPDGSRYQLDAAARQYLQPFDQPREAALAVYLHSYRHEQSDSGPTRLLVQVGIQGTTRQSGLRPKMNVGVVLDLRGDVRSDGATAMRALLAALVEAKQVGDRFSVTIAGGPGGLVVEPEDFRHGPLTLAMGKLFGGDTTTAPTLSLVEAMASSLQTVASGDDPTSALGASLVLLVTPSRLADDLDELERLAHSASVSGIPTSVVGVGAQVDLDEIDRLVLSGQGNRRLLGSPDEAEGLVDRELHAVSRVIARAVRLRIRLKPGVRLIDMLGSNRLDAGRAERVREAERSVDLRLARNLGIDADRGDDEEGMQVVIPSYYAGDSHVLLLDVVTDRPGSIADVTVRYKDLVYLRNGVARANLTMERRLTSPAPLELNVLKNLVALRLSEGIGKAGDLLAAGDIATATQALQQNRDLLNSLRGEVNGWSRDVELMHDANMLSEYLALMSSQHAAVPRERQALADSMLVAGRMKVQARRH